ncbi:MAG: alpha/beta hydrolase [Chloroflexi bacterium]|nr:alpha/beta hydrolase [Chloroflexota bacterium]
MARSEDLRFRAGDASLAGTLRLPDREGEGRMPWVLLLGSWLPRDRDGACDRVRHPAWFAPASPSEPSGLLLRLADALARRGVASFRFDPRGCGESDGDWASTDLFTRIDDARDAIGAMRSRRELDLRRTAIVGHGESAAIALSVAIGDPAIGAVGLIGPGARSWRDLLRRGVAERERTGADREHPLVAALDRWSEELLERARRQEPTASVAVGEAPLELRLSGWLQAIHTPALALATMLHRPAVLAHARGDAWAHPDESRLLLEVLRAGGNEPAFQLLDAREHDLADAPDGAIGAVAEALADRMQPRELPPVLIAIEEMGSPSD